MQKNMLLNLVGVAALSLLCACGPAEVKHEAVADDKHAEAEIPTEVPSENAEATMQVAEVEQSTEAMAEVAAQPAAEAQQVAEAEAQEQKA